MTALIVSICITSLCWLSSDVRLHSFLISLISALYEHVIAVCRTTLRPACVATDVCLTTSS